MVAMPDRPSSPRLPDREEVTSRLEGLQPRLRKVLDRMLVGESEKEAANSLHLSIHTIHDYVQELYLVFGVDSRAELMACFISSPEGRSGAAPAPAPNTNGNPGAHSNGHASINSDGPVPEAEHRNGSAPSDNAEVQSERPARDAPEEEYVLYCVQLLARRGFIVRYTDAAKQAILRHRGLATLAAIVLLSLCTFGPPQQLPGIGSIRVSPPVTGEWHKVTTVSFGTRLTWRAHGDAALKVGAREFEPDVEHILEAPGIIYARSASGAPDVLVELELVPLEP